MGEREGGGGRQRGDDSQLAKQKLSSPEETPFGGRSAVSLNRFAPLWVQVGSWILRERLSMDRSVVAASAAR